MPSSKDSLPQTLALACIIVAAVLLAAYYWRSSSTPPAGYKTGPPLPNSHTVSPISDQRPSGHHPSVYHPATIEPRAEHFGGGGPDGTAYAEEFDKSHKCTQEYIQRVSIRSDDGPDDEYEDDSRMYGSRIYATGSMDPVVMEGVDDHARALRYRMMGHNDLSPCNCAPESCKCPWAGSRRSSSYYPSSYYPSSYYPSVPHEPLIPEVGVEVGPLSVNDWGIPCNYAAASGPIRWEPDGVDHYGPEGATIDVEGMYSLTEPDHLRLH